MRILLLNDSTLQVGLRARGHEVRSCGPEARYLMPDQDHFEFQYPAKTMIELSDVLERLGGWQPDLIIHTEIHTNFFYRGIEAAPCPTVWRTIDNHLHAWQPRYSVTHDMVMVAQKDYLPAFEALHPHAYWLPLNSFAQVHFDRGLARDIPVAFVGSLNPEMHPERAKFFAALRAEVPVDVRSGLNQGQMAEFYNHAQIVVNQCVHKDLNYRVFEAMANGALLITPRIENGLLELFTEGRELLTYPLHDAGAAARLCRYYLEHPEARKSIAKAGQLKVQQLHTLEHRLDTLLELLRERLPQARASRRSRLNPKAWQLLFPLYAALHSQRYANANLACDALRGIAAGAPVEAMAHATRVAVEHIDGGRAALAEPYLELARALGARGAVDGLLGRVRMTQGRVEDARALLETAVVSADKEPTFFVWLALCLEELGERDRAVAALQQALLLQPGRSDATRLLERWARRPEDPV